MSINNEGGPKGIFRVQPDGQIVKTEIKEDSSFGRDQDRYTFVITPPRPSPYNSIIIDSDGKRKDFFVKTPVSTENGEKNKKRHQKRDDFLGLDLL